MLSFLNNKAGDIFHGTVTVMVAILTFHALMLFA